MAYAYNCSALQSRHLHSSVVCKMLKLWHCIAHVRRALIELWGWWWTWKHIWSCPTKIQAKNMNNYDFSEEIFNISISNSPTLWIAYVPLPTTTCDISLTNKNTLNCHLILVQDKSLTCMDYKSCQKWANVPCIHSVIVFGITIIVEAIFADGILLWWVLMLIALTHMATCLVLKSLARVSKCR